MDYESAVSADRHGAKVVVWAVAGANRTQLAGLHGDAIKVRVALPAEGGKANREIARLLGARLGVAVELVAGRRGRRKVFLARGIEPGVVADRLRRG